MKTSRSLTFAWAVLTAFLSTAPGSSSAASFPLGQLLVSDSSTIYLVDPASATSNRVVTGLTGLRDVVYNPVSRSAFATQGTNIVQISAGDAGYSVAPFVSGIAGLQCLAVDAFGQVYFHQQDFVQHKLWRAGLDGSATALTAAAFFVPRHMAFSKDYSKLFVFETPNNDVRIVSFPSLAITTLASGLDFPPGGDSDALGNVYVLEDFGIGRISKITSAGARTTYAQLPWMEFTSGDDLEYDAPSGTIYATAFGGSTGGLHELRPDLTSRWLMPFGSGFFGGLSLIRPGAPVISSQPVAVVTTPGASATFSVGAAAGGATFQWRFNGRNIPGATGATFTIPHAGFTDAGMYSVIVVSAGGAALSSEAALSVFDLSVNPVVTLAGPIGAHYRIEYRLGMEPGGAWQPLTNVTATTNPYLFVDQTTPPPPNRFYRAVLIP